MLRPSLLALCLFVSCAAQAAPASCAKTPPPNPLAAVLAQAALAEYQVFNGHRINADGQLWKFGSVEAETELLYDPKEGQESSVQPDHFAWRRVWHYWLALNEHREGSALRRRITWLPGLLDLPATDTRARSITLGELMTRLDALPSEQAAPLREAVVRVALIDTPWSAAFISYLMHQANLSATQFNYSSAHADYIRKAFEAPQDYAYRACDPRTTTPRVGDLICYSRGSKPLENFAAWQAAVGTLGGDVKSHCDLVTAVDLKARKMESIGGNVLQSVTRRSLKLNEQNHLSDTHQAGLAKIRPGSACAQDQTCHKENLNLQYWGVLLQLQ